MDKLINILEFNNNYPKLHGQKRARLLMCISEVPEQLLRTKYEDLLIYDTYRDDGKFYRSWSPGEKFLLLIFLGEKDILFTSLRKQNEENLNKYADSIGEEFYIKIKEG